MKAVSGQECSNSLKVEISLELLSYLFKTQQLSLSWKTNSRPISELVEIKSPIFFIQSLIPIFSGEILSTISIQDDQHEKAESMKLFL